jgi:general secretion pathway protein D
MKRKILISLSVLLLIVSCAVRRDFKQGSDAFQKKEWDQAAAYFLKAVEKDPDNVEYRISLAKALISASTYHLQKGKQYFLNRRLNPALVEFEKALEYNPENNEARRHKFRLLKRIKELEKREGERTEIEQLKENAAKEIPRGPRLKPEQKPYALKFSHSDLKMIFNALQKASGIRFIYDEAFKSKRLSLDLDGIQFSDALDKIMIQTKLFYKVLDEKTVLIIPDTPAKRKQYEELVMKTLFLSSADPENIQKIVHSLTGLKTTAVNKDLNTLTLTGTPAGVRLAERIVRLNDKSRGELFIDIEIIEVNRSRLKDYGIELSQYQVNEAYMPETGSETTAATSTIRAHLLPHTDASDYLLTLPSINYKLLRTDSHSRIKARPQLRVIDREKVEVRLGDKVPIPTTSFVPYNTSGPAQQPITSYQMQDIGINIELTPHIHHDGLITLEMKFELTFITNPGSERLPPTIGNRSVTTMIKLRDNESSILAGLLRDTERKSMRGIPFLSQLPVLKEIFSGNTHEVEQTDIILTLTPRIIRFPDIRESDLETLWVGTAEKPELKNPPPKLRLVEEGETNKTASEAAEKSAPGKTQSNTTSSVPAVKPAEQKPSGRIFSLTIATGSPSPLDVGSEFPVALSMEGSGDIKIIKVQFEVDPAILEIKEISEGKWLKQKETRINFFQTVDSKNGKMQLNFTVESPAGEGLKELALIHFKAIGKGSVPLLTPLSFETFDSQMKPVTVTFSGLVINIGM